MSCEDQALVPTRHCTLYRCQQGFDDDGNGLYPTLELRGHFWYCPRCGASYGTAPHPETQKELETKMVDVNVKIPDESVVSPRDWILNLIPGTLFLDKDGEVWVRIQPVVRGVPSTEDAIAIHLEDKFLNFMTRGGADEWAPYQVAPAGTQVTLTQESQSG